MKCIAQQKTNTSLATKGVVFCFPLFHSPPKNRRRNPGGLSSLFTRGDGAEVPLVGLRNDACGTSRRPVDGGEEVLPKKPIGVIGLIDIVIVVAPSSNIFFKNRKHIGCAFFMRPVSNRLDRSTKLYGGGSFGSWGFDDKCWCFCLLPFWRYFIFLKKRWPMVQIDWWGCYHDKINPDI